MVCLYFANLKMNSKWFECSSRPNTYVKRTLADKQSRLVNIFKKLPFYTYTHISHTELPAIFQALLQQIHPIKNEILKNKGLTVSCGGVQEMVTVKCYFTSMYIHLTQRILTLKMYKNFFTASFKTDNFCI